MPRRSYSYSRVSSDEQAEGYSLDGQAAEHVAHALAKGFAPPIAFSDIESGSDERERHRTGQVALLQAVVPGDCIIISKLDRWSRDLPFAVGSIRKLVARGIDVYATSDVWTDARKDDSIIGIMAWAADQERRRIRERTVGTRVRMRASGVWAQSGTPTGYDCDETTRKLVPNEDAALVQQVFAWCIEGKSLHDIGRLLRERYPSTTSKWHGAQVRSMLDSRIYLGEIRPSPKEEPDRWVTGTHPAIVSELAFIRAKEAREKRRTSPRSAGLDSWTREHAGRELMTCSRCGHRVSLHGSTVGGVRYRYYVCSHRRHRSRYEGYVSCTGATVPTADVDQQLGDLLVGRIKELRRWVVRGDEQVEPKKVVPKDDPTLVVRKLEGKRERLLLQYEDGDIDRDRYRERLAVLDQELETIRRKHAEQLERETTSTRKSRARLAPFVDQLVAADLTGPEVREALSLLTSKVVLHIEAPRLRSRYHRVPPKLDVTWVDPAALLRSVGAP